MTLSPNEKANIVETNDFFSLKFSSSKYLALITQLIPKFDKISRIRIDNKIIALNPKSLGDK